MRMRLLLPIAALRHHAKVWPSVTRSGIRQILQKEQERGGRPTHLNLLLDFSQPVTGRLDLSETHLHQQLLFRNVLHAVHSKPQTWVTRAGGAGKGRRILLAFRFLGKTRLRARISEGSEARA